MAAPASLPDRLRSAAHASLGRHAYAAAAFYAEQLAALPGATAADAALLAHAHLLAGHPRRALAALSPAGGPTSADPGVRHLAARALAAAGDWEGALDALGGPSLPVDGSTPPLPPGAPRTLLADAWTLRGHAHAALDDRAAAAGAYKAALATDPAAAVDAFHALVGSHLLPPAEEAALVAGLGFEPGDEWLQLLFIASCSKDADPGPAEAALAVLEAPPPTEEGNAAGEAAVAAAATAALAAARAAARPPAPPVEEGATPGLPLPLPTVATTTASADITMAPASPPPGPLATPRTTRRAAAAAAAAASATSTPSPFGFGLATSVDVAAARASAALARGDPAAAHAASSAALARDPAAPPALVLPHLAACVALRRKAELLLLSHRLIASDPADGLAWHAAGCYYLAAGAPGAARRHFGRAVALSPNLAPAWLGAGHAASALDEADAALGAYRAAARLFPGAAGPLVGMACEHARTGSAKLAEALLAQAHAAAPGDPAPCHELAALLLRPCGDDDDEEEGLDADLENAGAVASARAAARAARARAAEAWARAALARSPRPLPKTAAPTLVALGHALRRQRRLGEATAAYERAAALDPADPCAAASLGLAAHAAGDTAAAAGHYHAALGLAPGDGLVAALLADALRAEAGCATSWIGGERDDARDLAPFLKAGGGGGSGSGGGGGGDVSMGTAV